MLNQTNPKRFAAFLVAAFELFLGYFLESTPDLESIHFRTRGIRRGSMKPNRFRIPRVSLSLERQTLSL